MQQQESPTTPQDDLRLEVSIGAPRASVWLAIVTPSQIKDWFFDVETESSWEVGAPIVHRGTWEGDPYEDKGWILAIEPPEHLAHTHWSPSSGTDDAPENYERVDWALEERGPTRTQLVITETNFASDEAREVSRKGWQAALTNLKNYLER